MSEQLPPGGAELSPAELDSVVVHWAASAWTPSEIAQRLVGVATPWCVAAGWALDLFRGEQTRPHGDLEIAVPAADFPEIRDRFPGYAFDAVSSGRIWRDAAPDVLAATHQTWLRDPETEAYRVDVFREPHDGTTWISRHDPTIRLPYREIIRHTPDGIPYLTPELVLLFKAKHARPKDCVDFESTVPFLTERQQAWLAELLAHTYPGHQWLDGL
ncbi:nucleotidyltransferase domain-containing protein [Streptacidiphilus fuscans]|uniref:Amino acid transporter n=1 Tax=Streptacidiphilus fuscans TaxID=2789292 RepID=A0A931BCH3_9ACTN|nr:hypothetical protein [Streptacidiphilus fuscans]MBF9073687.1 hypothetical protein [Streptacidiphilus fuscans]